EVKVEDREPSMGLKRAQDAIRLAVAGIGLLLPPNQADQIGLADEWRKLRSTESLTQVPGEDVTPIGSVAWPEVGVNDGELQIFLAQHKNYLKWLGLSIKSAVIALPGQAHYPTLRRPW